MKKTMIGIGGAIAAIVVGLGAWWFIDSRPVDTSQFGLIRIGIDVPYAPFAFYDEDGELTGFEIELGNRLCNHLNVRCEWVVTPWDTIIDDLNSGKFDMILSSMSITEERKERVAFSKPYYSTPSVLFTSKSNSINDSSASNLAGLRIATQSGTVQEDYLREEYPNSQIVTFSSWEEIYDAFYNNNVDVLLAEYSKWEEDFFLTDEYKILGDAIRFGDGGVGMAFRKDDTQLRKAMNQGMDYLKTFGDFQQIRRKYFFYDIMVK